MAGGALATALNQVFFPTAWYELVPVSKVFKLAKKGKEGIEAAIKAKKTEQAAEAAAKEAKIAKEAADAKKAAEAKKAEDAKKAGNNGGGSIKAKKKKSPEEACKHKNDSKKKKYIVYKADQFDKDGNKIGTYVGRTSGEPNESVRKILDRRQAGHAAAARKGIGMAGTRNLGQLQSIFETNSYAAVRGAEHLMKDQHGTVKQINPIGPNNERKTDYLDCAKSKGAK